MASDINFISLDMKLEVIQICSRNVVWGLTEDLLDLVTFKK